MNSDNINIYKNIKNELIILAKSRSPDTKSWSSIKQEILKAASYFREKAGQKTQRLSN